MHAHSSARGLHARVRAEFVPMQAAQLSRASMLFDFGTKLANDISNRTNRSQRHHGAGDRRTATVRLSSPLYCSSTSHTPSHKLHPLLPVHDNKKVCAFQAHNHSRWRAGRCVVQLLPWPWQVSLPLKVFRHTSSHVFSDLAYHGRVRVALEEEVARPARFGKNFSGGGIQ